MKNKKQKQDGFFKNLLEELTGSIVFEVMMNLLLSIPKLIIRILKNIW